MTSPKPLPPWVDAEVLLEMETTIARLSPAAYSSVATPILNSTTPKLRAATMSALRSLVTNQFLFSVEPAGLTIASLFALVAFCEGKLRPYLHALVELAAEEGHIRSRLTAARADFGMMLTTLREEGRPTLATSAPKLLRQLDDWDAEGLSHLRNGVAHFNFEVVIETIPDPTIDARARAIGPALYGIIKLLGFSTPVAPGHMVDLDRSFIRFEGVKGKRVSAASPSILVQAQRRQMRRVEEISAALQLGFVAGSRGMTAAGTLMFASCAKCKDSNMAFATPFTDLEIQCPTCGFTVVASTTPGAP